MIDGHDNAVSNDEMSGVATNPQRTLPPEADMGSDVEPLRPTIPMSMPPPGPGPRPKRRFALPVAACALTLSGALGLGLYVAHDGGRSALALTRNTLLFPERPDPMTALASGRRAKRADANLDRKGRSPVAGGLMFIPPSFESEDGAFDLVVHFHGNTDAVEESFGIAKIDAVVVILNLGNGSGPYEDRFENAQSLVDIDVRVLAALKHRGLEGAHRRRLALSAWSAGYGAIARALGHPNAFADVDAVLLEDGIHAGYAPGTNALEVAKIAVFEKFGKEAIAGRKLLSIAHSDVKPNDYAGTHETTDALLADLGVKRGDPGAPPIMPQLKSIDGVVAKKSLHALVPLSEARSGDLIVRGYKGDQPEDHTAHLFGMAATTLPDLIRYWAKKPEAATAAKDSGAK